MFTESLELNVLMAMFGLFLLGLWFEARRTLKALANDPGLASDEVSLAASTWEDDYETVMQRSAARRRLVEMRSRARQSAQHASRWDDDELMSATGTYGARYDLKIPEFRLIEGGGTGAGVKAAAGAAIGTGLSEGGARTPMTREGRKTA